MFYGALMVAYAVLLIAFGIQMLRNREWLLSIQFCIIIVIVMGLAEVSRTVAGSCRRCARINLVFVPTFAVLLLLFHWWWAHHPFLCPLLPTLRVFCHWVPPAAAHRRLYATSSTCPRTPLVFLAAALPQRMSWQARCSAS